MRTWMMIIILGITPFVGSAQLTGTYTIGGGTPDFSNINDAVDSLNTVGVAAAVTFNIRTGTYMERVMITEIAGASAVNTITFRSEGGDSTLVNIQQNSYPFDSNYVVFLNGADHVTIKQVTFTGPLNSDATLLLMDSGAHHNQIRNNLFLCDSTNPSFFNIGLYSPNGSHDTANIIANNHFYSGGFQVMWYGKSTTELESGTEFTGNFFEATASGAALISNQDSMLFSYNTINSNVIKGSGSGFSLNNCHNGTRLLNNTLIIYGDCNGGFYLSNSNGSASSMILAANNVISMGGPGAATGMIINSSTFVKFHNNSIHMYYQNASPPSGISGSDHSVMNNIFVTNSYVISMQPGKVDTMDHNCYYTTGSFFGYYAGDSIYTFSQWQDSSGQDANSLFTSPFFLSNTDLHVTNPMLDAIAVPTAGVTVDMDGDVRDAVNPDIGADEFTPEINDAGLLSYDGPVQPLCIDSSDVLVTLMNFGSAVLTAVDIEWSVNSVPQTTINWVGALASSDTEQVSLGNYTFASSTSHDIEAWTANPNGGADIVISNDSVRNDNFHIAMSGTYTIGGGSPDFDSVRAAAANLNFGGMCGPVTFNIRTGTYEDQFRLGEIEGNSAINTITFQSESGDSSDVLIHHEHAGNPDNYVIYLEGADYVTIRDLTLQADSSAANRARVVVFDNQSVHGNLMNCELIGQDVTSTSTIYALIYSFADNDSSWTIANNRLRNGSNGIYLKGELSSYEAHMVVQNNRLENGYGRDIFMQYTDAPVIEGNIINGTGSADYKIYLSSVSNGTQILGNHIWTDVSGVLYMNNVDGTVSDRVLIANNFFTFSGSGPGSAMYCRFSDYVDIYHNSINVTNTDVFTEALYHDNGVGNNIQNNIFVNTGGGYATYIKTPAAIDTCDYNDHYATGVTLGYWNGDVADLAAWQAASSQDPNGLSIDPVFTSATDLHASEFALDSAGIAVVEVTDDFDGEARNVTTPDIGADEFGLALDDAGILSIDSPAVPLCDTTSDVIVTLQNNGKNNLTSVDIKWTLNGTPQSPTNWTGNLTQGSSVQVNLGNLVYSAYTSYDFVIWTEAPNTNPDDNLINDTTRKSNFYMALSAGTYTIGGATPDFNDFSAAAANLNNGGICGPVVFEARDGTYNDNMALVQIEGASAVNRIRFTSESGDSSAVTLNYTSAGELVPTVELEGTDHLTIDNLTLKASGASFAQVLTIWDGASFNTFSNNVFLGLDSAINSWEHYVILSDPGYLDSMNVFRNNKIMEGSAGMVWYGKSTSEHERGNVVENNIFTGQFRSPLTLEYQDGIQVNDNVIISIGAYTRGIGINNCLYPQIQRNHITMDYGSEGIWIWSVDGTVSQRALFANNFIQMGGAVLPSNGIEIGRFNDYINVYNNSIHVTSTDTNSYAIYVETDNTDSTKVYNNILVNSGGGSALFIEDTLNIPLFDNNCYFSVVPLVDWFGTDLDSLYDWVSKTGMGINSIFVDPLFTGATDLHVSECALDGAGKPLSGVTDDFDGDSRNPLTPDIGADEFGLPGTLGPFLGNDSTICKGDSLLLDAGSGFAGYLWEDSSTTQTLMANGGTYWVEVSDVCSNTLADTIVISESFPLVDLGGDMAICDGDSLTLDGGAGFISYLWNEGSTTQTLTVSVAMAYSVTVTDSNGCIGSDSMGLTVYALPVVDLGADTTINGGYVTLDGGAGFATYAWSDGSSGQTLVVTTTDEYSVTVTDGNGCKASDTVFVTIIMGIGGVDGSSVVRIYPNPSKGNLVIVVPNEGDYLFVMKDLLGRVVDKRHLRGSKVNLNMELKAGIYFAEIQMDDGRWVIPVVIRDW